MKQEWLVFAKPTQRRYGSHLGKISLAPENILNRDFTATAPNEKWRTDISEFQIAADKVYLLTHDRLLRWPGRQFVHRHAPGR